MTGDDPPGLERLDLADRVPPGPEAADGHAFPEVPVNAVVDHIPGGNQPGIGDVEDAGDRRCRRGRPPTITRSCPSSVKRLPGTVTAVTGDGGIPGTPCPRERPRRDAGVHLRDRPAVATTRAPCQSLVTSLVVPCTGDGSPERAMVSGGEAGLDLWLRGRHLRGGRVLGRQEPLGHLVLRGHPPPRRTAAGPRLHHRGEPGRGGRPGQGRSRRQAGACDGQRVPVPVRDIHRLPRQEVTAGEA
jgi:hypothetical protein